MESSAIEKIKTILAVSAMIVGVVPLLDSIGILWTTG
jgi:hypothetical protein